MSPNTLIDWFQVGGWMMYPILACSLLGLAVTFERLLVLGWSGRFFARRSQELRGQVLSDSDGSLSLPERELPGPLKNLLDVARDHWSHSTPRLQEALTVAAHQCKRRLEAHLNTLSVISQATPLMGLLGTVWGMVQAFLAVQQTKGPVNPATLAGGIWEALLTTVFGLLVAIPAYLIWHALERIVDERLEAIEELASALITVHEEQHDR